MTLFDAYIKEVQSGEIITGQTIKQAIDRHLNDVKKSKNKSFPFVFNAEIANTAVNVIQVMPLTSARGYQPFPLQKWQCLQFQH